MKRFAKIFFFCVIQATKYTQNLSPESDNLQNPRGNQIKTENTCHENRCIRMGNITHEDMPDEKKREPSDIAEEKDFGDLFVISKEIRDESDEENLSE